MEFLENFITVLDYILSTNRKRHITGGILLSMSALLGGLAITAITVNRKEDNNG